MTEVSMTSAVKEAKVVLEELPDDLTSVDTTQLAKQAEELQKLADQICKKISRGKEEEEERLMAEFLELVKSYGGEVENSVEELRARRAEKVNNPHAIDSYDSALKGRYCPAVSNGNDLIVCCENKIFALVLTSEQNKQTVDLLEKMSFKKSRCGNFKKDFILELVTNKVGGSETIIDEIKLKKRTPLRKQIGNLPF